MEIPKTLECPKCARNTPYYLQVWGIMEFDPNSQEEQIFDFLDIGEFYCKVCHVALTEAGMTNEQLAWIYKQAQLAGV